jgi:glycerophosphoryl diester phosphodiesterase
MNPIFILHRITAIIAAAALSYSPVGAAPGATAASGPWADFTVVAHAGGAVDGYLGSNSIQAAEASLARGVTLIELDFLRALDGDFICAHDWEGQPNRIPFAPRSAVSGAQFANYRIFCKYTPINTSRLIEFLNNNQNCRIITDTKQDDYGLLEMIARDYPQLTSRFIPQVYAFEDYGKIEALGYKDIIITLYAMPMSERKNPAEIAARARQLGAYALTLPDGEAEKYAPALNSAGLDFYAHTINDINRCVELKELGAAGVYSDLLYVEKSGGQLTASYQSEAEPEAFVYNGQKYSPLYAALMELGDVTEFTWSAPDESVSFVRGNIKYRLFPGTNLVRRMSHQDADTIAPGGAVTIYHNTIYAPESIIAMIAANRSL